MSIAFWIDQASSMLLVNFCWWLSHENQSGKLPLRRLMSLSYAALGMMVLGNMLLRSFEQFHNILPWSLLASKVVLVLTLGVAAARLTIMEKEKT